MKPRTIRCLIALVLAAACCGGKPATRPGEKVWDLTSYLHGTTEEVRDTLNGQLEELLARQADYERRIDENLRQIAQDREAIARELHATPEYVALIHQRDNAQADMEQARRSGTLRERMDASSRFNKAREKLAAMDSRAEHDPVLERDRRFLATKQDELARVRESAAKARDWRNEVLSALIASFRMPGPIRVGSSGIVGTVHVERTIGKNSALVRFRAFQTIGEAPNQKGNGDGIRTYEVIGRNEYLLLTGIDTAEMHEGEEFAINRSFEIIDSELVANEIIYTAAPKQTDEGRLIEAVTPLRVPATGR